MMYRNFKILPRKGWRLSNMKKVFATVLFIMMALPIHATAERWEKISSNDLYTELCDIDTINVENDGYTIYIYALQNWIWTPKGKTNHIKYTASSKNPITAGKDFSDLCATARWMVYKKSSASKNWQSGLLQLREHGKNRVIYQLDFIDLFLIEKLNLPKPDSGLKFRFMWTQVLPGSSEDATLQFIIAHAKQ